MYHCYFLYYPCTVDTCIPVRYYSLTHNMDLYSLLCVRSPVLYSTHTLLAASQLTQGMLRPWSNMGLGGLKLKACKGSQQYQLLFLHFWFLELRWIFWTVCKNQYSKTTSKHTCAKAVWRLLSSCNMWYSVSILSSK